MKVTLKQKKLASGKLSLYIEYYKGSYKDENGKEKHNREFEYLNQYLLIEPRTKNEREENQQTLQLAENILALRKADVLTGRYGFINPNKGNYRLYDYFDTLKEHRSSYLSNYGTWISTKRYIEEYFHPSTTFNDITPETIESFKRYLDTKAITKYNTPLKHGSKYSYFNRFRAVIKSAYEEGFLTNPKLVKIKSFEEKESAREFLTIEEVQRLAQTDCKYPILKRAFLFSCLTGLRWSDVYKLKWSEVRDENKACRIVFTQQKTDNVEYLYISDQARLLLGDRSKIDTRVFVGLHYGTGITTELLRWCMKAEIDKHITFHCARHTAATLLLDNGADLYTVMKVLGHQDIRTTQIYTKILDRKLKETANLLPSLNIKL